MNIVKKASFLLLLMTVVFSVNAAAQVQDSLLAQAARKWSNAKAYALQIAGAMPEEYYNFRPVPAEMSFKQQLLHITQNMEWLSSAFLLSGTKAPVIDTAANSKAAVMQILSDAYDSALAAQQHLTEKQLDEVVPFFAGPLTRRQVILLLHDHQSHHLGQLIVYLRLKGIAPPEYIGW